MKKGLREALKMAVDALGGEQEVGSRLWPEMNPISAGERLGHCLQRDRRERLNLDQIDLIFSGTKAAGRHDGFNALADGYGYHVVAVLDPMDEIADTARRAAALAKEATETNEKLFAQMRAAGLKVE